MIGLLDTNMVIAMHAPGETTPDLSAFDTVMVSSLTWSELTRGLHTPVSVEVYRARRDRIEAARRVLGEGIPFDDSCVAAHDRVLARVREGNGDVRAHQLDRMIAATAIAHDLMIVTRDATGFAGLGGLVEVTLA